MIKTIMYIVISGVVAFLVLWQADVRELNNSKLYDGCYEKYISNHVGADNFRMFMSNCME